MFSLLVFLSLFSISTYAETTRGTSWEETCTNGICTRTLYSGIRYTQNSTGHWVSPSDVLYITKNQDDLTFHYNGIKGYYNIMFEAGAIYNGNYYSMSKVKQMKPEIQFDFPSEKHDTYHKYAVNISNITGNLNPDLIENITLTYKEHYGFTLDQLTQGDKWFFIKNTMALYFEDLLEKYTLKINISEKRIYISNISQNIINGSLYLDPTVQLQDAVSENLGDAYVDSASSESNFGTDANLYVKEWANQKRRTYIMFNISSIPSNKIIDNSMLCLYQNVNGTTNNASVYHVINTQWTSASTGQPLNETTITWDNQTCGTNFGNSTYCNLTKEDTQNTQSLNAWICWTTTQMVNRSYTVNDKNISMVLKTEEADTTGLSSDSFPSRNYTTDISLRPYLNITYSLYYPKWYSNQSSIPSDYDGSASQFNITWNITSSAVNISKVFFESNYSGTAINYSMTNSTYGGDIFNYSVIISPGTYYWKSYANTTEGGWNSTDTWTFTVPDITNPSLTGLSYTPSCIQNATTNMIWSWYQTDNYNISQSYGNWTASSSTVYKVNSSLTNNIGSATDQFSPNETGTWYFRVYLYDTVGNQGSSSLQAFDVQASCGAGEGGDGGGGGGLIAEIIQNVTVEPCMEGWFFDTVTQKCLPKTPISVPFERKLVEPLFPNAKFPLNMIAPFHIMLSLFVLIPTFAKGKVARWKK